MVILVYPPQTASLSRGQGNVNQIEETLSPFNNPGNVDPNLITELTNAPGSTANIFIEFPVGSSIVLDRFETLSFPSREDKITNLRAALIAQASGTQAPLTGLLTLKNIPHTTFWITNQLFVPNANLELVKTIATFGTLVSWLRKEMVFPLIDPVKLRSDHTLGMSTIQASVPWNLEIIGANCPTIEKPGDGIVVSHIDTGVLFTHVELIDSMRLTYNWFDPVNRTEKPFDDNGHGTHTMGSIVGKTVGVAPHAKWITCRGCPGGSCPESPLIGCGQWVLCPTLPNNTKPDCRMIPHIVSNSWGDTIPSIISILLRDRFYLDVIKVWRACGIIPVFAAGNSGPACFSVGQPASFSQVFSVGATDMNDAIAYFSSRGPSFDNITLSTGNQSSCLNICRPKTTNGLCIQPIITPTVCAPGVDIRSSWNTSPNSFEVISGTSMATPHVAGVIALMIAENIGNNKGNLTYDEVFNILTSTAVKIDIWSKGLLSILSDILCNGLIRPGICGYPNYVMGYGRVDACAAVTAVRNKALNMAISTTDILDEL
ncbi:unnamed protein product [Orchesella dallaii]|uniref:Peptidase S8/S53 domain-containing protein n=1 Tax=Orchesella dallaii TaxID=48710 RepID=A0ABP1Q8S3_9HEXA